MPSRDAKLETFVTALLLLLLALFVADHDAWTPDEPRVVGLAQSVARGSWVVPRLNGTPFLEEPPLHVWAVAGAYRLVGETVTAARLVSALAGALCLAWTCLYARHLAGRRAGALAALALGLSSEFFMAAHRIVPDGLLAACVAGSAYASLRGLTGEGRSRTGWLLLAYALASLAYLAKGVVGVGLSGFAFLAVVAAQRDPRALLRAHLWAAPLVFLAVTGPWHRALAEELGPGAVREVLLGQTLLRAAGRGGDVPHRNAFWFYFAILVPCLLPAGVFSVLGAVRYVRERAKLAASERFAHEAPLLWLALGVVALSLAASKREVYLVPLLPAAAVVAGVWLDAALAGAVAEGWLRGPAIGFASLLGVAGAALPVTAWRLGLPFAEATLGGLALLGAAIGAAWLVRRGRTASALATVAAGAVLALLAASLTFVPLLEAKKGQAGVFASIAARVPADHAVHAFLPDEATRGAFPFATDRPLVPIDGKTDLARRVHGVDELWLLVVEKNDGAPITASLADLAPEVVLADDRPGARSYRLLRFRGPRHP